MALHVEPVSGRRGTARFIDVPWHIYAPGSHPHWVPPLRLAVRGDLDTRKNPFYRKADLGLFVATDGSRVLGRVAAVENRWHNEHHGDRVGFFGFFECVADPEVAGALIRSAETWLTDRGLDVSRGPVSPSMNHECGLLVDGFEGSPMVFTPWNPPYYADLVEGAGYTKAMDLLAYHVPMGAEFPIPERLERIAARHRARSAITFRGFDFGRPREEIEHLWACYRDAWAGNWGFVPPSRDEFLHLAEGLRLAAMRDLSFIAEEDGRAVGFMLCIHDLNQIFRTMPKGRLTPLGLLRLLLRVRSVKAGRVILLGLTPEARRKGLFHLFVNEVWRRGRATGVEAAEASWVLEDNHALTAPLEAMGLTAHRRWRLYDKALSPRLELQRPATGG